MAIINKATAQAAAIAIRDETVAGANTAARVGGLLKNLADSVPLTSGVLTQTGLSGARDNYNVSPIDTCFAIRISTPSVVTFSGIANQGPGAVRLFMNVGTTGTIILLHESGLSDGVNRFKLPDGQALSLPPGAGCLLWCDADAARWTVASLPAAAIATLAEVLAEGNETDGTDIILSGASVIRGHDGGEVPGFDVHLVGGNAEMAAGGNIVLTPGTGEDDELGKIILEGDVDGTGFAIKNILDPVAAQDAATKAYVDTASGGGWTFVDVTAAESPYTAAHGRVVLTVETTAPVVIILPTPGVDGDRYIIKDGLGSAPEYNITVSHAAYFADGTPDETVIAQAWRGLEFAWDPNNSAYALLSEFGAGGGGGGGGGSLADALGVGNSTGGVDLVLSGGSALLAGSGTTNLQLGYGAHASKGNGGAIGLTAQTTDDAGKIGGEISLLAGSAAPGTGGTGGNVVIQSGKGDGAGYPGSIALRGPTNLDTEPVYAQDVATKQYVDAAVTGGGGGAPTTSEYLVGKADAGLSAERVVTDTTSIVWDLATGSQAKAKRAALTGDVTASADSNATTIAASVVTNAKLADVATARIKGRVTAATGAVEDLTGTQCTTLLDVATTSLKGLLSSADKTKLDGIATGATATALSAATPADVAAAGAVGVGTTAARSDHAHALTSAVVRAALYVAPVTLADASATVTLAGGAMRQILATTADRAITLSATGAYNGARLQIDRYDTSNFSWTFTDAASGDVTIFAPGVQAYAVWEFRSTAWELMDWGVSAGQAASAGGIQPFTTLNSPCGLWLFDGNLNDSSGNARHFSIEAGTEKYSDFLPGKRGLYLDGSTKLIAALAAGLQLTGDMGCIANMKFVAAPSGAFITHEGSGEASTANVLYFLGITAAKQITFFSESGAGVDATFTTTGTQTVGPNGSALQIGWTRIGGVFQGYVNGQPFGAPSGVLTTPTDGSVGRLRFGGTSSTLHPEALCYGLKLFDVGPSAAQMLAEFNATLAPAG